MNDAIASRTGSDLTHEMKHLVGLGDRQRRRRAVRGSPDLLHGGHGEDEHGLFQKVREILSLRMRDPLSRMADILKLMPDEPQRCYARPALQSATSMHVVTA